MVMPEGDVDVAVRLHGDRHYFRMRTRWQAHYLSDGGTVFSQIPIGHDRCTCGETYGGWLVRRALDPRANLRAAAAMLKPRPWVAATARWR